MLELHGGPITLREFLINDSCFGTYYEWVRCYENMRLVGRREYFLSVDMEEVREYVRQLGKSRSDCFFLILYEGNAIGTLKIGHINWETLTADIGVMIGDRKMRGKGLSILAVKAAVKYSFEVLGMRKLSGGCASENIPMQKCFEQCGFVKEGNERQSLYIEGKYQDHLWYGMLIDEYKTFRERMEKCRDVKDA